MMMMNYDILLMPNQNKQHFLLGFCSGGSNAAIKLLHQIRFSNLSKL